MRPEDQHQPYELTALELRIQQAADLVVPSDTLRGRIVGEALRRHRDEQTDRRILRYGFTFLLARVCVLFAFAALEKRFEDRLRPVTSDVLLRRADELRAEGGLEPAESLALAYDEWRMHLKASGWTTQPNAHGSNAYKLSANPE
jgi:hypothetical protein